ncbi:enterobactin transporter EntS [Microbulbifer sp. OS29]|uniref:Enterobactin transporter EntS n=1 Tax=Microbulbifer okhotskensis TaxID=2926617 RepID=A0A9X2J4G8_9GAMM|nr:enterobactin transporter EntS [Microbulbifer okhotskensis]MCO1334527.1 enterobactin transporter EntS [Microbulbifer okhotskensis]
MNPSLFMKFDLLKSNTSFRMIFIARMISIISMGMLTVAVPVQIHSMTGSTIQVGVIMTLEGISLFIGLLWGGVLADRYNRRTLVLIGRSGCGLGFAALAVNCFFASPSLIALYALSIWSGLFGAIGITALMASIPSIVGKENLAPANALSMLTVRIGTVISPAIGGLIIAATNISWNYTAASVGTFATLIPLTRLPSMVPSKQPGKRPLKALAEGFSFLFSHKIVGSAVAVGTLDSLGKGVRVLFPALVTISFGGGAFEIGLMYSAVPLGAMLGALTSGWAPQLKRPGAALLLSCTLSFVALGALTLSNHLYFALLALVVYGYLGATSSLIQITLVQSHTPNPLQGRVNSLWVAQNVTGDTVGAMGFGLLGKVFAPMVGTFYFAAVAMGITIAMSLGFSSLKGAAFIKKKVQKVSTPAQNLTPQTKNMDSEVTTS